MGDNKYKKKHKELGLCIECSRPAAPFSILCFKHTASHYERNLIYDQAHKKERAIKTKAAKLKRKAEGRCITCGGPKHDGRKDKTECQNCTEKLYFKPRILDENYTQGNAP